jgi:hypothetical protein
VTRRRFQSTAAMWRQTGKDPDSGSADLLVVGSRGVAGLLEP